MKLNMNMYDHNMDWSYKVQSQWLSDSESELFTGGTSKDNQSPGPVIREASP